MRAVFIAPLMSLGGALDYDSMWSEFKDKHSKMYANITEDSLRLSIFAQNARFIDAENNKGHDFELAINGFGDLAAEEFAASYLGVRPSLEPVADSAQLGTHTWQGEELPESVDWVTSGAVTPVKDQAACGSCWAFSAVGALEGALQLASGSLQGLSEQQLVDCAGEFGNYGCSGGMMDFAFSYAKGAALCTDESYPYAAADKRNCSTDCKVAVGAGEVTGYYDIGHRDEDLMSALAQQPVSVAIEADLPFFQFYHRGVYGGICGGKLDHGVLAVGYGNWTNGKPYWKIKNSWGPKWGMDGFILLKKGTRPWKHMGECGVLKMASYPEVSGSPALVV